MKSFSGKASLMATLVAALVGASSAQAAEIKIGVVLPLSGALSGYGQPSQKGLDIIQAITPTLKNGDTIKPVSYTHLSFRRWIRNGSPVAPT